MAERLIGACGFSPDPEADSTTTDYKQAYLDFLSYLEEELVIEGDADGLTSEKRVELIKKEIGVLLQNDSTFEDFLDVLEESFGLEVPGMSPEGIIPKDGLIEAARKVKLPVNEIVRSVAETLLGIRAVHLTQEQILQIDIDLERHGITGFNANKF